MFVVLHVVNNCSMTDDLKRTVSHKQRWAPIICAVDYGTKSHTLNRAGYNALVLYRI